MKKNYNKIEITILSIGAILVLLLLGVYFSEIKEYSNIVITLLIIDVIVYILYKLKTRSPESIFKSKIKNIINTYDSILAKVDKIPDLSDKDIIYIQKFEELINTQGETKKPIFYNVTDKTASFVLIDNNLVCYTIIKENEELIDPIENQLMTINAKKNIRDVDESILKDIERTTIIKLPSIGSYKVSPIRKKDAKEDNNETEKIIEEPVVIEEHKIEEENNSKIEEQTIKKESEDNALETQDNKIDDTVEKKCVEENKKDMLEEVSVQEETSPIQNKQTTNNNSNQKKQNKKYYYKNYKNYKNSYRQYKKK